jgi:hypothetical protein
MKMKIKILRNLGRRLPPYKEGEVLDLPDREAESLVKKGLAEAHDAKKDAELQKKKKEMREAQEASLGVGYPQVVRAVPPAATIRTEAAEKK